MFLGSILLRRCLRPLFFTVVVIFCGDFFSFLLFFCTEILDLLDPAASSTGVLLLSFLSFFWFCEDFFSFLLFCCTRDCFFVGLTGVQLSSVVLEIKRGRNLRVLRFFFCEFLFKSLIFWFCCGFLYCRSKGWRQGDWVA